MNEIGGRHGFFAPFAAGIALYQWRKRGATDSVDRGDGGDSLLLALALLLGQSRLALFGVVVTLGALIFLLIPARRWRSIALARWWCSARSNGIRARRFRRERERNGSTSTPARLV